MKFINGAVVMTDIETGKPYSRFLSPMELNLVLGQLQALDGGTLNAREVAPFIIRTPGVTEDEARELIETEQAQTVLDRLVGKRVTVQITPAKALAEPHPFDAPPAKRTVCYQCGSMSGQRYDGRSGVLRCEACNAEQCERIRCKHCGITCTRPEGHHYCNGTRFSLEPSDKPANPEES